MDQCVVCGMDVDPNNPPAQENFKGQNYNFCSEECKQKFDENPQVYANRAAA